MKLPRWLAVVPYLALCLPWVGTVPMWDAREYTDCIETAARQPLSWSAFNCAGHPTTAWAAILTPFVWLAPERLWPIVLVSAALGVVGLLAFYDLVLAICPGADREAALLTLCLGVFPVVVSGTVDINPDHGVLVFFLLLLRALVRGKIGQAGAIGLLLVFTKEPGVLLGGLAAGVWALVFVIRGSDGARAKVRRLLQAWPLAVPPAAFGVYVLAAAASGADPLWHTGDRPVPLLRTFTTFHVDQAFRAQLVGIFVLQFAWVLTALAVWGWARIAARAILRRGPAVSAPLLFCNVLLLSATLLLTRYQTFLNLRYYIAIFPLLLICGFAGLRELWAARPLPREATLAALALAFGLAALRTVDPVSKALMGTVRFGEHDMLDMTRATGECCGHGRDQIAYNLEHLHLGRLESMALAEMHRHRMRFALAGPDGAEHHTVGRIDAYTLERTLSPQSIHPRIWDASSLLAEPRPQRLLFLRYFFIDSRTEELRVRRLYREVGERTYSEDGYALSVADYVVREDAAARK